MTKYHLAKTSTNGWGFYREGWRHTVIGEDTTKKGATKLARRYLSSQKTGGYLIVHDSKGRFLETLTVPSRR